MNKLETRALIENTGNYEEEEIEEVMDVLEVLEKHMGYEDNRSDKRFVVKFHDIFYYTPEEFTNTEQFNDLFDMFCNDQYDYFMEEMDDKGITKIDVEDMLDRRYCGHYQTFKIEMPYIEEDNIVQLAQDFYEEYNYEGGQYVEDYITVKNALQELEDNYVSYWIQFLKDMEVDEKIVKETETKYNEDLKKKGK